MEADRLEDGIAESRRFIIVDICMKVGVSDLNIRHLKFQVQGSRRCPTEANDATHFTRVYIARYTLHLQLNLIYCLLDHLDFVIWRTAVAHCNS